MKYILSSDGEKLYYSKNVAEYFNMNPDSMNEWLRVNHDFSSNTKLIVLNGGGERPKRYFTQEGVIEFYRLRPLTPHYPFEFMRHNISIMEDPLVEERMKTLCDRIDLFACKKKIRELEIRLDLLT